jgi:geranylgeranyl reductase family protein
VKVLVVGAGPSGSLAAIQIARKGYDVTLIEEHSAAGFPVQCAGLISLNCYERLRRFVSDKCHVNDIRGAFFFAPDGSNIELRGKSKAVVIERKILDSELLKKASESAEIRLRTRFLASESKRAFIRSSSGKEQIEYDFLIGADGVASLVAKQFGFKRPRILSALQIECFFEAIDEHMVELYFGKNYSDCFFGYAVPIDENTAKLGVISSKDVHVYLKNLLEIHPSVSSRVQKRKVIELNAGAIPIGLVEFVKDNVALIGDAAGMVKPYTGGGLYYHLVASEILGKMFPKLNAYQRTYLKRMGREYEVGMRLFKLYSSLSDQDYINMVKIGKKERIEELVKSLHMDSPASLLKILPKLLKIVSRHPKLSAKMGKVLLF